MSVMPQCLTHTYGPSLCCYSILFSRLVCQRGDVVTLRWSAVLVATGAPVDIRKTHFSLLTERGEPAFEVQVSS